MKKKEKGKSSKGWENGALLYMPFIFFYQKQSVTCFSLENSRKKKKDIEILTEETRLI
jgi:hypothetical protein